MMPTPRMKRSLAHPICRLCLTPIPRGTCPACGGAPDRERVGGGWRVVRKPVADVDGDEPGDCEGDDNSDIDGAVGA